KLAFIPTPPRWLPALTSTPSTWPGALFDRGQPSFSNATEWPGALFDRGQPSLQRHRHGRERSSTEISLTATEARVRKRSVLIPTLRFASAPAQPGASLPGKISPLFMLPTEVSLHFNAIDMARSTLPQRSAFTPTPSTWPAAPVHRDQSHSNATGITDSPPLLPQPAAFFRKAPARHRPEVLPPTKAFPGWQNLFVGITSPPVWPAALPSGPQPGAGRKLSL
ncbi:hypothetical protein E4U14_000267, partial [Claviceps sp. LM454 group G7]